MSQPNNPEATRLINHGGSQPTGNSSVLNNGGQQPRTQTVHTTPLPNPAQPPQKKKGGKCLWIALGGGCLVIIIIGVLLLFGVGGIALFATLGEDEKEPQVVTETVVDTVIVVQDAAAPASPADKPYVAEGSDDRLIDTDYSWICTTPLTRDDVASKGKGHLRIMRNTIYARHGYKFKDKGLQDYFDQFSWYEGYRSYIPESEFTQIERDNIKLIKSYE